MKKNIVWEKWRDDENFIETQQNLDDEVDNIDEFDDDDEDDEKPNIPHPKIDIKIQPYVIRTPLGDFSVLDHNLPSKNFDCWIGHFNFPITEEVFYFLDEEIEGIEVLKVLSKYRIFVGVGKLFQFRDVQAQIRKLLLEENSE